jgi:hypothetical protein
MQTRELQPASEFLRQQVITHEDFTAAAANETLTSPIQMPRERAKLAELRIEEAFDLSASNTITVDLVDEDGTTYASGIDVSSTNRGTYDLVKNTGLPDNRVPKQFGIKLTVGAGQVKDLTQGRIAINWVTTPGFDGSNV